MIRLIENTVFCWDWKEIMYNEMEVLTEILYKREP